MIAKAIEALTELAQEAAAVKLTEIGLGDPRKKVFYNDSGVRVEEVVPVQPRNHAVGSVDDFLTAVKRWGQGGVIWHNDGAAVLVCDDATRWDRVVMLLTKDPLFDIVASLGDPMDQRSLVRLLRFDLSRSVSPDLLAAVRKIEISTSGRENRDLNPGREKGMREFNAELANEVPETFPVAIPVYQSRGLQDLVQIQIGMEVTLPPQPVTFRLAPLAGELDDAVQTLQDKLHALLLENEHELDVLFGNP